MKHLEGSVALVLNIGRTVLNPLNSEINPICRLLALLGTHPILHVSRIRVKGYVWVNMVVQLVMASLYEGEIILIIVSVPLKKIDEVT